MTTASTVWAVLIAAQAVINIPFVLLLLKGPPMPVPAEIQAQLDAITADLAKIPDVVAAKVAAAESAMMAAAGQNAADTLTAVTAVRTAVDAAVAP